MADKSDDAERSASATPQFTPAAIPTKDKTLDVPVKDKLADSGHRPVRVLTPSAPGASVDPQPPPAKEGYDYWTHLPYEVEDDETRIACLNEIIGDLYAAIKANDFDSGARVASRQIKQWLHLKFKMPKETRQKLAKLYYELSLTPGMDPSSADSFANMFKGLDSYSPQLDDSIGVLYTMSCIDASFVQTPTLL
jgi:proteasome activator subunit 4